MPTYRTNLDVRDGDVEELVHLGVPHEPDVGDDGCPQVTLKIHNIFWAEFFWGVQQLMGGKAASSGLSLSEQELVVFWHRKKTFK